MRVRENSGGLSVNAIAGSYVVLLGIDLPQDKCQGLRGFAVQRSQNDGPASWMQASKIFPFAEHDAHPGDEVPTNHHPVQDFLWSDFTARPGVHYTYRVVAMYSDPQSLTEGPAVTLKVTTEAPDGGDHEVHFNRGVAASQQYARKFGNKSPKEVGAAAWNWLSRGLVESIQDYISQANSSDWGLRVAAYEFTYAPGP